MKPHVAILSLKARMDWLLSKNRNDHRLSSKQKQMVVGGKNLYPIEIDRDYLLVGHPFLDHTSL